jgi:predicted kinase
VVFAGLPGTGKSTLAERIARITRVPAFSGDWMMGALRSYGVLDALDRPTQFGLYYDLIMAVVTRQLALGQSMIVDCLVTDERIHEWQEVAAKHDGKVVVVECVCSDTELHRSRVADQKRDVPGWHEVDWDHVERMREQFPPLSAERLTVDAVNSLSDNCRVILEWI